MVNKNDNNKMLDLAIIPARSGSVGLKNKNILLLGGMPLINWTIKAALDSKIFKSVIVSTDDKNIARIAAKAGAEIPFIRPKEISNSTASAASVIIHALRELNIDGRFAYLQPTSPFRSSIHLRQANQVFNKNNCVPLVSVSESKPESWLQTLTNTGNLVSYNQKKMATYRQKDRLLYVPNGAIFLSKATQFINEETFYTDKTKAMVLSKISGLDIDDLDDFNLARAIVNLNLHEIKE